MTALLAPRSLRALRPALLLLALSFDGAAQAQSSPPEPASTAWACWYAGDQQVACVVEAAPATPAPAALAAAVQRLDPRLPAQVRSMRTTPGQWRHKTVLIPLWDEPFDHAFVAQLAQSVMCGAASDCRTRYHAQAPVEAPPFAALLADANDPVLAD